jgi:hypothetical protein
MQAGFKTNYLDISGQYTGVLNGVGNTLATFASVLSPMLAGYFLTRQDGGLGTDPDGWAKIFIATGKSTPFIQIKNLFPYYPKVSSTFLVALFSGCLVRRTTSITLSTVTTRRNKRGSNCSTSNRTFPLRERSSCLRLRKFRVGRVKRDPPLPSPLTKFPGLQFARPRDRNRTRNGAHTGGGREQLRDHTGQGQGQIT